jgi:DNA-binding NarL/FixJ family response regulator
VLDGNAAHVDGQRFGLLVDAINPHLASAPQVAAGLPPEHRRELGGLFPALADFPDASQAPSGYGAQLAMRALIEALASNHRLALVLDDVHSSDEASLELLGHFLRRPSRAPILLLLGYRHSQAPSTLADAVAASERLDRADLVELGALLEADVAELAPELDARRRSALYRESGGIPLYVVQLLSAEEPGGGTTRGSMDLSYEQTEDVGWVPPGAVVAITAELAGLSAVAQEFARAAAVLGDPFEYHTAAAVGRIDPERALSAIDELVGGGFLTATSVPRQFAFRQPIVGHAVYAAAGQGWRLGAHQRAAVLLRERGRGPTAIAWHLEQGAEPGDLVAIEGLFAAGIDASDERPELAVRWLRAALRLLGSAERDGRKVRVMLTLGPALAASGRFAESLDVTLKALDALPVASPERTDVALLRARLESLFAHREAARSVLEAVLAQTPEAAVAQRARIELELGYDALADEQVERAQEFATRALTNAHESAEPVLVASAAALLARLDVLAGRSAEAAERLGAARAAADRSTEASPAVRATMLARLAAAALANDQPASAVAVASRGLAIASSGGLQSRLELLNVRAAAQLLSGELAQAAEDADEGLHIAVECALESTTFRFRALQACVALMRGDVSAAIASARAALTSAGRPAQGAWLWLPNAVLVRAQLSAQKVEVAELEELVRAAGGSDLVAVDALARASCARLLAETELASGRSLDAERWLAVAEQAAGVVKLASSRAEVDAGRAALSLVRGRPQDAAASALMAAFSFEQAGRRVEAAMARVAAGRAVAATGDRPAAIGMLEAAISELRACGAGLGTDEAARELRRLGRRVGTTGPREAQAGEGLSALTRREREVASLVAAGHTNKEIAARLFLSERTIESHLSRIFSKLDVSSRSQLATEVARAELGGAGSDADA